MAAKCTKNVGVTPCGLHLLALSGDHTLGLNYASFIGGIVCPVVGSGAYIPTKLAEATEHDEEGSKVSVVCTNVPVALEDSFVYGERASLCPAKDLHDKVISCE